MRPRAAILTVPITVALALSLLTPPAAALPSSAVVEPPVSSDLVAATNAMLRPGEGPGSARGLQTGFAIPPGGQDPLPICVYATGYTTVSLPRAGAIGYRSASGSIEQVVYQYASASVAKRTWTELSARIQDKCTGTRDLGGGVRVTLQPSRVAGAPGGHQGWGVRTSGSLTQYSVVHLVGDAIQMVSIVPDNQAIPASAVTSANALARALETRWLNRATAPLKQDPVLTKAETVMLTAADVPASLPITPAADDRWTSFDASAPGSRPDTCSEQARPPAAQQSFMTVIGDGGDVFSPQGTVVQTVHAYPDAAAARRAWRSVRAAVLGCNQAKPQPISPTTSITRVRSGTSGLEIHGVPGVWSRTLDTYPAQPGTRCEADGRSIPCPSFTSQGYTITLLVGETIQSLTYGRSRDGVGTMKIDQLTVNTLAEQLAQRWTPESASADTANTTAILDLFKQISQVPRCSKHEGQISAWLLQWAKQQGFAAVADAHNNVLVKVPGSAGRYHEPPVALQAHMDMVCAKTAESSHDFTTEPIQWVRDGDWLHADKTTLGADDGIGVAIAMFLATEPGIDRPPLELLFTTDEEIDMSGAEGLAPDALTAKRYINIDWETEGSIALGSAGGMKRDIALPMTFTGLDSGWDTYRLNVTGLRGGHSGLSAGKGRANANVLVAQLLKTVGPFRLATFDGGTADNAMAPSATAVFAAPADQGATLTAAIHDAEASIRAQYPGEKDLSITLARVTDPPAGFASAADSQSLVGLLLAIPQDVYEWSTLLPGLPMTSNNIGVVRTDGTGVTMKTFARSFDPTKLQAFSQLVLQAAQDAGATSTLRSAFPTWPPDPNSDLYKKTLAAYQKALGKPLDTIVVHAGLECGFIAEKFPGMEIISLGPTLIDVHTPDERLNVPSVDRVLTLLRQILKDL